MTQRVNRALFIALLAASSTAMVQVAHAEEGEEATAVGVTAKVGTLGVGAELTIPISKRFNGRLGFNSYKYSKTIDSDLNIQGSATKVEYDGDIDLNTAMALLDWHPFAGTFRVTAGYVFNNNSVDAESKLPVGSDVQVGDNFYTIQAGDSLTGAIDFTSGPYLGLGWGNAGTKGWGFSADLGVLYQGEPDVTLTAGGNLAAIPGIQDDLRKQEATAEDDLSSFKYYPVASIGVSYGFSL